MTPNNQPSPECVRAAERLLSVIPAIQFPLSEIGYENCKNSFATLIARETRCAEMREALTDAENEIENAIIGLNTNPLAYNEAIKQRLGVVLEKARAALEEGGGK